MLKKTIAEICIDGGRCKMDSHSDTLILNGKAEKSAQQNDK